VSNKRIGYKKFWHKVNGKLQFSYKKLGKEIITIASYREIAKFYSLVKYVKVKGEASVLLWIPQLLVQKSNNS